MSECTGSAQRVSLVHTCIRQEGHGLARYDPFPKCASRATRVILLKARIALRMPWQLEQDFAVAGGRHGWHVPGTAHTRRRGLFLLPIPLAFRRHGRHGGK